MLMVSAGMLQGRGGSSHELQGSLSTWRDKTAWTSSLCH